MLGENWFGQKKIWWVLQELRKRLLNEEGPSQRRWRNEAFEFYEHQNWVLFEWENPKIHKASRRNNRPNWINTLKETVKQRIDLKTKSLFNLQPHVQR